MQGAAQTTDFMLGAATIMLGPQADLFNLTGTNSIGLVKNVTTKSAPSFVELTQGIRNSLVYSVMNQNKINIMAEMYEYTASNLAYALSLDGAGLAPLTASTTIRTAVVTPPVTLTATQEIDVADSSDFSVGDYVLVTVGTADNVMIRKVTATDTTVSDNTITLDLGLPMALTVGMTIAATNIIAVGAQENAPFLACKIVGTLANGQTIPMLFPKVRVSSGLSMAFKTDNFDHIPLELEIFDLVSADPHFARFSTAGPNGTAVKGILLD